jgi:hypothetical protein
MEVDLEMTGGVPAWVKYSMAQDVVRGSMFIAKGDRGEPDVVMPELISRNPSPAVKLYGTKRYLFFHACLV